MAIDLLKTLQELKGDFRGAVLLTYTLDLTFFEQLVAPKLTALGCTNILIITDQYGYDESLQRGARNLHGVGKRYACTPLRSAGRGIQHAKLLLLVGPQRGCLLVGSGNLTMPGYGRNLEQFTRFDLDLSPNKPSPADQLHPFNVSWQLVNQLHQQGLVSTAAGERLAALTEIAPWLNQAVTPPAHLQLWHSLIQPLFDQLPTLGSLTELHLIAPFFDLTIIDTLVNRLHPAQLIIGVDAHLPRLDGLALAERCRTWGCELELRALQGRNPQRRSLHAKTIVGVSDGAVWSISGSANITFPAWRSTWTRGGNLELVVWQHSTDSALPARIWEDEQLLVQVRNADAVYLPPDVETEDEGTPDDEALRLVELNVRSHHLAGQLVWNDPQLRSNVGLEESACSIELLRSRGALIPIQLDASGRFSVSLPAGLGQSEAGRVVMDLTNKRLVSLFHWIDQLDELARFGYRSYHVRIRQQLESFTGAGQLFEDLLNFLWARVDPQQIQQEHVDQEALQSRRRRGQVQRDENDEEIVVPPVEDFITEETLVTEIGWHVDGYLPHDRSTVSLRDLLSLALLRLTTETTSLPTGTDEVGDRNEDADTDRTQEQETKRRQVLEVLRDSLLRYCAKYARRLLEPDFVANIGPQLLFDNHFTLGRVLLEFADKAGDYFTQDHLRPAVLHIFGALFWPAGARLDGSAAWHSLQETGYYVAKLRQQWAAAQMPVLTAILIAEAWEQPPRWTKGLNDQPLVQRYLLVQELMRRIEQAVGPRAWHLGSEATIGLHDLWGFRQITTGEDDSLSPAFFTQTSRHVQQLVAYQTPVEEKYANLFTWWRLQQNQSGQSVRLAELSKQVEADGFSREMDLLKSLVTSDQLCPIQGDNEFCPKCFIQLPGQLMRSLHSGQLVKCSNCRRTVLYWQPVLEI